MRLLSFLVLLFILPISAQACALQPLPKAMSNHAVAWAYTSGKECGDEVWVLAAGGLIGGKTWQHVSKEVYLLKSGPKGWSRIPDLPMPERGVLAATAQGVKGQFYIIGGYTVAPDGSEKSTPYVFRLDPETKKYTRLADMPIPVDDTVSFVYQDRYIYLVSGWHDTNNVSYVQVYDIKKNTWKQATKYPGTPVFGHAGGIVGNKFIIADGVAFLGKGKNGKRQFGTVNKQWMGTIDPENPVVIKWQKLPQLPGKGHYRMAATGDVKNNRVLFTGGSTNAYNYSGIGYNGVPSRPSLHTWAWDFTQNKMIVLPNWSSATMDHRGLVWAYGRWTTVGGMGQGQKLLKMAYPHQW